MSGVGGTTRATSRRWGGWLGVPFFAWMYGTPVGFVMVLVNTNNPAARWYALGWVSWTVAIPLVAVAVAYLFGAGQWRSRFLIAALLALVFAVAGSVTWHAVAPGGPTVQAPSISYLDEACPRAEGPRHCPVG